MHGGSSQGISINAIIFAATFLSNANQPEVSLFLF